MLRKRLTFIYTLLIFTLIANFIAIGYTFFKLDSQIKTFGKISHLIFLVEDNKKESRSKLLTLLKNEKLKIKNFKRVQVYNELIEKLDKNNSRSLGIEAENFIRIESAYLSQSDEKSKYHQKNLIFISAFLLFSLLAITIWSRSLIAHRILKPVEHLKEKMESFLKGKYTYAFKAPEKNEIGDLELAFNQMAQKVIKNMEDLKVLDEAKSEFLNIASHELRTPMTSIKGSLGLISSGALGDLDSQAVELIKIAEGESDRLIRIINEFLDLAKIEARRFELKKNWEKSNEIIDRSVKGLNSFAESQNVKIQFNKFSDFLVHVDGDRIQQVLTNLLSNAIKFSPENGQIAVFAKVQECGLKIMVSDQGEGISPSNQKKLFQKFRQVTSEDNPLVKGTGLGLAISKALIEEHGGEIGVESNPGKGSTFYFILKEWKEVGSKPNSPPNPEGTPESEVA